MSYNPQNKNNANANSGANGNVNNRNANNSHNGNANNAGAGNSHNGNANNAGAGNGKSRYRGRGRKGNPHKGMIYKSKEDGLAHEWDCPVVRGGNMADFEELKDVELLSGMICPKCGKSLLFKKYTDDVEEGRALSRFLGDLLSPEFLCEMYETYHIYPYVINGAMKLSYKDNYWKITKNDKKFVLYHNEMKEDMPGWFNDYWKEYGVYEGQPLQDVFQVILEYA